MTFEREHELRQEIKSRLAAGETEFFVNHVSAGEEASLIRSEVFHWASPQGLKFDARHNFQTSIMYVRVKTKKTTA